MSIIIPEHNPIDDLASAQDPWISVSNAVRWAAWRGKPEPVYGVFDVDGGNWISFGDMEERDRLVYLRGAREVRQKLAEGALEAWGQNGSNEPEKLAPARWGTAFHKVVSWVDWLPDYDRIQVSRIRVLELWPAEGKAIGRRASYNWDWVRSRAEELFVINPKITRRSLTTSLATEYSEKFSDAKLPQIESVETSIRRKLQAWNLPPSSNK